MKTIKEFHRETAFTGYKSALYGVCLCLAIALIIYFNEKSVDFNIAKTAYSELSTWLFFGATLIFIISSICVLLKLRKSRLKKIENNFNKVEEFITNIKIKSSFQEVVKYYHSGDATLAIELFGKLIENNPPKEFDWELFILYLERYNKN